MYKLNPGWNQPTSSMLLCLFTMRGSDILTSYLDSWMISRHLFGLIDCRFFNLCQINDSVSDSVYEKLSTFSESFVIQTAPASCYSIFVISCYGHCPLPFSTDKYKDSFLFRGSKFLRISSEIFTFKYFFIFLTAVSWLLQFNWKQEQTDVSFFQIESYK